MRSNFDFSPYYRATFFWGVIGQDQRQVQPEGLA